MSGLISFRSEPHQLEQAVAEEALFKYNDEEFESDGGCFRFFSGGDEVKMYNSYTVDEYELMGVFDPIEDAEVMAAYLQEQFDSMRSSPWRYDYAYA